MRRATRICLAGIAALLIAFAIGACAEEPADLPESTPAETEAPDAEPSEGPAEEPAEVPAEEPDGGATRPTVAEAEAAVLQIAREQYSAVPALSAEVVGMGQDSAGNWWVQGWTDHGSGYESEQWFIIFDGTDWTLHDMGTGMERTDYPSDIAWEDVS